MTETIGVYKNILESCDIVEWNEIDKGNQKPSDRILPNSSDVLRFNFISRYKPLVFTTHVEYGNKNIDKA